MKEKQFLIASHGHLAEGLYDSLTFIMGEQPNVSTFCAYVDDSNAEEHIDRLLQTFSDKDLIILTDLYGGSVNNMFLKYISCDHVYLVSGINLPLLIEMICTQHLSSDQMIKNALLHLQEAVRYCNQLVFDGENGDF